MKGFIQGQGFRHNNVRCLNDFKGETIDRTKLESDIEWLKKRAKNGDTLFFYFTGHGNNASFEGIDYNYLGLTGGISYYGTELKALLTRGLPSGVTVIAVFDQCHSGGIMRVKYELDISTTDKWKDIPTTCEDCNASGNNACIKCTECGDIFDVRSPWPLCPCGGEWKENEACVPCNQSQNNRLPCRDGVTCTTCNGTRAGESYPVRSVDEPVIVAFTACQKGQVSIDNGDSAQFTRAFIKAAGDTKVYEHFLNTKKECGNVRWDRKKAASSDRTFLSYAIKFGNDWKGESSINRIKMTPRCETNERSLDLRKITVRELFSGICDGNGDIFPEYTTKGSGPSWLRRN
jgi:hypothetical protein